MESKPRRPAIGFMHRGLTARTHRERWWGAVDEARARDADLFCFIGGRLRAAENFESQANIIYDLVDGGRFDGLAIWLANIGAFLSHAEAKAFAMRYRPLPVFVCDMNIEGFPTLPSPNYEGMRELMRHLIVTHGYRRIAFINGPEDHQEAQDRYRGFADSLAEHGLSLDSRLVSPFGKWQNWGDAALRILLDERGLIPGIDFEVLVATNIMLAREAWTVLKERGVEVPGRLALVAADDSDWGMANRPSITTVSALAYQRSRHILGLLVCGSLGDRQTGTDQARAWLAIRRSCGCASPAVVQAAAGPVGRERTGLADLAPEQIEAIVTAVGLAVAKDGSAAKQAGRFVKEFLDEMNGSGRGQFVSALEQDLSSDDATAGEVGAWQAAVSVLRKSLLPFLSGALLERAEDVWNQARVAICQTAVQAGARHTLQFRQLVQILQEIAQALISTINLKELTKVLLQGLPQLGIPSCYLSLYENPRPYEYPQAAPEWSRLVFAYDERGLLELEPEGQRFPSRLLMPDGLPRGARRRDFVVEPLYFKTHQLGFVLLEMGPREGAVYESLRGEISSTLHRALLVRRVQERSAELIRQEYILNTVMDNVPDYIYFKDLEGRFTRINNSLARVFGLNDPAEAVGKNDYDFFPFDHAQNKDRHEREIIRTGRSMSLEESTGKGRWSATTKMPLRDEKGNITGTFGLSHNITELKKTQAALELAYAEVEKQVADRTAELRGEIAERQRGETALKDYRLLVENSPLGIMIHSRGRIVYANPAACRLLGAGEAEELLGRSFLDFVHADFKPVVEERVHQVMERKLTTPLLEEKFIRLDGSTVDVEVVGVPFIFHDERAVQVMLNNITERKRAFAEIARLNAELEERVAERTAELEAANRELEAFSYSVSHDLRAPLRAIHGFSRIVLEEYGPGLPAEAQRYLSTVHESSRQMGRLIDDLLAFSRLGRKALSKQAVDMAGLVREALQGLEGERAGRALEIEVGELPAGWGDAGLLRQVWTNLLSNAIKFTRGRAAGRIEVGSEERDGERCYYVKDNGAGFDQRYAAKLFGVFQRLHREEEFEGTGVGLAIVQRIIQRHGGRVWAEGEPGVGATFRFSI